MISYWKVMKFNFLDEICQVTQDQILDLEFSGLNIEQDCKTFTGYTKQQLIEIENQYIHTLRNTEHRSKLTALWVYLTKLRTGLTHKQIAALMKLSELAVDKAVSGVRDEFGYPHV
jgi:hypothetical protein